MLAPDVCTVEQSLTFHVSAFKLLARVIIDYGTTAEEILMSVAYS